ncbi:MAG: hypothetical protein AAGF06_00615 [Pseudomonadota bacterium]
MKSIKLLTAALAISALTACASVPNPVNVVTDAAAKTTGAVKSVAKGTADVVGKTASTAADATKAVATKTVDTAKRVVTPVEAHKDAAKKTASESIESMKQSMDAKMVDTANTAKDTAAKPGTEIDKMSDAMNTKMKNASEKIDNTVLPSTTK